jgi:hypothetical protein
MGAIDQNQSRFGFPTFSLRKSGLAVALHVPNAWVGESSRCQPTEPLEEAIEIVRCGRHDRPPTPRDDAAVLGRVQGLRCAPPPLRGAPRAPWTRPPRGSRSALIVGGNSVSSNGNGHGRAGTVRDVLGADRLLGEALLEHGAQGEVN